MDTKEKITSASNLYLAIFLAISVIAGGVLSVQGDVLSDTAPQEQTTHKIARPQKIIYGKKGILTEMDGNLLQMDTRDVTPTNQKSALLTITTTDATEWLETIILRQLPRDANGVLVRDNSIRTRSVSKDRFQPGDTIYTVADQNIAFKTNFSAVRVYRIVYE